MGDVWLTWLFGTYGPWPERRNALPTFCADARTTLDRLRSLGIPLPTCADYDRMTWTSATAIITMAFDVKDPAVIYVMTQTSDTFNEAYLDV